MNPAVTVISCFSIQFLQFKANIRRIATNIPSDPKYHAENSFTYLAFNAGLIKR